MKLAGKVALVTGGGTGIGRESVLALAQEGAALVVNYSRSQAEAEQTAAAAREYGGAAITLQADVSSDLQVRQLVHRTVAELGRLDILVNNAGHTHFVDQADLEGLTEEMWDRILAVNLKGTFFCCRAAAPIMRQQGAGCIINISSIAGLTGGGSCIAYAASKAGVMCLTKSLARVLAPEVRVNAVAPGIVATRWTAPYPEFKEKVRQATPLGRVATPAQIAEAVHFLATSASYVTGETIIVDGGRVMA